MTFAAAWANRHDRECESIDHPHRVQNTANFCHCYRRWLERRLAFIIERLKMAVFTLEGLPSMYPETRRSAVINQTVMLCKSALLPPKGACLCRETAWTTTPCPVHGFSGPSKGAGDEV